MNSLFNYRKTVEAVCLPALAALVIFGTLAPVALAQQSQGGDVRMGEHRGRRKFERLHWPWLRLAGRSQRENKAVKLTQVRAQVAKRRPSGKKF